MIHSLSRRRELPIIVSLFLTAPIFPQARTSCSNETFHGAFGFTATGTNIMMNAGCDNNGRFVADGKGNMSGALTEGQGGHIQRVQFTGTYTVKQDCTGSAKWVFPGPLSVTSSFVLGENGAQMYFMNAEKGPIVNAGMARKQGHGFTGAKCSSKSFYGPFGVSILGTKVASNTRFAVTGAMTPDGLGHITGNFTEDVAGQPQQYTITGTYKVNDDCTGSGTFESSGQPSANFDFVLVNGNNDFYLIYTDDGTEASGIASRLSPRRADYR